MERKILSSFIPTCAGTVTVHYHFHYYIVYIKIFVIIISLFIITSIDAIAIIVF